MLRALEEDVRGSKAVRQAVNSSTKALLHAVSAHLQASPLFADALRGITAPDVEGCVPSKETFSRYKAQGAEAFKKQDNWQALWCYTEALRFLGVQGQQEAARIHCNRALVLVKLSKQGELHYHEQQQPQQRQQQQGEQQPEQQPVSAAHTAPAPSQHCVLLEAAESEASAALCEDPSSFKAHYRRASCRQLLGRLEQGLEDCSQALHILATSSTATDSSAAARDEVKQLQRSIQQQLQEQQVQRQQQMPRGPDPAPPAAPGIATQAAASPAAPAGTGQPAVQQHMAAASSEPPAQNGGDCVQALTGGMLTLERAGEQRKMVAVRSVPAGSDVLREEPIAFVIFKAQRLQRCGVCAKPLASELPLPSAGLDFPSKLNLPVFCRGCPLAAYCSVNCRDEDVFHNLHSPECGLPWPRILPEEALLATRLATWEQRLATAQQQREQQREQQQQQQQQFQGFSEQQQQQQQQQLRGFPEQDLDKLRHTIPAGEESMLQEARGCSSEADCCSMARLADGLLGHEGKQPRDRVLSWSVLATMAAAAHNAGMKLKQGRQQEPRMAPPALPSFPLQAQCVLKWLCRIAVNGVALRPIASALGGGAGSWGNALFPVAACFNHSCQPNLSLRFDGCTLIARASEDLNPGSEALISYGPQVGESSRTEREQHLQSCYHFDCCCRACAPATNCKSPSPDDVRGALRCPCSNLAGGEGGDLGGVGACAAPSALLPLCSRDSPGKPEGAPRLGTGSCSKCGSKIPPHCLAKYPADLKLAAAKCDEAASILECLQQGDGSATFSPSQGFEHADRAFALYMQGLRTYERLLHPCNLLLGAAYHTAAKAAALVAKLAHSRNTLYMQHAADLLHQSLSVLAHHFPPNCPQLAFEQASVGACIKAASQQTGGASDSNDATQKAEHTLRLHFGEEGVVAARHEVQLQMGL